MLCVDCPKATDEIDVALYTLDLQSDLWTPTPVEGDLDSDEPGFVLSEKAAADLGIGVGDTFDLRNVTQANLETAGNGQLLVDPDGTDFAMTVAGIERQPRDLRSDGQDREGRFATDAWSIKLTPAFWDELDGDVASYGVGAVGRLRAGVSTDDFGAAVKALSADHFFIESANDEETLLASIQRAADFEANALLLFSAVFAIAGGALVG